MSGQDLVSVIMPVFNGQAFLSQAIESVIGQTHDNWELVVIDDGSTDESFKIIKAYESKDKRIIALAHERNRGISRSRNRAIESSRGEWIAFLDCDDQWLPSKLEKQLQAAQAFKTDFVFTGASYIDGAGTPTGAS